MIDIQMLEAAKTFAASVVQEVAVSTIVNSLKKALDARRGNFLDFYIDVCSHILESKWVQCTTDDFLCLIQKALSSDSASEEVAKLITRGEFAFERLEKDFVSILGDDEAARHLVEILMNAVAHQVFELIPDKQIGFQIRIIVDQKQMQKTLEELYRLLPSSPTAADRRQSVRDTSQAEDLLITRHLEMLRGSLDSRVNPFINLIATRQDDESFKMGKFGVASPVKMAVRELLATKAYGVEQNQRLIPIDLTKSIENHNRAILLGEPGIGKTTTAEKLVLDMAIKSYVGKISFVPMILRCNQISKINPKPNTDTIFELFLTQNQPLSSILLESLLKNGMMLIVVDGLNELPREHEETYIRYLRAIEEFCKLYSKNKVLLTCREFEFVDIFPGYTKFFIQPLTPAQTVKLAESLLGENKVEIFFDELSLSAEFIKTASRNPYYFTSLAVIFDATGLLPQDNATLANLLVDLLLKRFSLENPSADISPVNDNLAAIAWNMLSEGAAGSWVTVSQLQNSYIHRTYEWINMNAWDLPKVLDIGCSSGILKSDPTKTRIGFYHQLLQEQIASSHLQKILFDDDHWRSRSSPELLKQLSDRSLTMGLDFTNQFSSVLLNLASRLSEVQLFNFMKVLCKTGRDISDDVGRMVPESTLIGLLRTMEERMLSQQCTISSFGFNIEIIRKLGGSHSIDILIDLCFKLSQMSEDRPEIEHMLRLTNRALKWIEMTG